MNIKQGNKEMFSTHIDNLLSQENNLYSKWCRLHLLKNNHFWTMNSPTDYSGTSRNMLKLRPLPLPPFQYTLTKCSSTSFWHALGMIRELFYLISFHITCEDLLAFLTWQLLALHH